MQKRAQITMFVILGIVIVMALVIGFAFRKSISEQISHLEILKSEKVKQMETDIKTHAETCLKKTAIEGILRVFAQGGYYPKPELSIGYITLDVPYYFIEGNENVPHLDVFVGSLAEYIDENINPCLESYSADLIVGSPKSDVKLGKSVDVEVSHSLSYTQEGTTVNVKRFSTSIGFDAKSAYSSGMNFFSEVKNMTKTSIVSQGLLALSDKYKFSTPQTVSPEDYIYILKFSNAIEGSKDVEYGFALKYPKPDIKKMESSFGGIEVPSGEESAVEDNTGNEAAAPEGLPKETLNEMHEYFKESGIVE